MTRDPSLSSLRSLRRRRISPCTNPEILHFVQNDKAEPVLSGAEAFSMTRKARLPHFVILRNKVTKNLASHSPEILHFVQNDKEVVQNDNTRLFVILLFSMTRNANLSSSRSRRRRRISPTNDRKSEILHFVQNDKAEPVLSEVEAFSMTILGQFVILEEPKAWHVPLGRRRISPCITPRFFTSFRMTIQGYLSSSCSA